jgi:DNA-binding NarL/FixJ family response regulator
MTNQKRRKVLIVDDHPLLREGISALINSQPDLVVCGEAEDPDQAMAAISQTKPDLILVDLSFKTGNGFDLLKELSLKHSDIPSLVLSMHDEQTHGERVLRFGARGYIMKTEAPDVVIEAIREVLKGKVYLSAAVRDLIVMRVATGRSSDDFRSPSVLSARECEIFQLVGRGKTSQEIAQLLHVSRKTVDAHKDSIRKKLGLENSHQLICKAAEYIKS